MPKVCPVCGGSYPDTSVFCPADGASLRAESTDGDLVGSVIAERYLVTELLGQGGMGTVYVARHVRLPLQAAIKVLRPEMLQDPSAIARFNREAANASRIEHERVARVFDFGETREGLVYLAMEFIPGVELKHLLKDGPLPLERTIGIIRQVADGLDAAHKLGIIHRDLKPDNIMVVVDDEGNDRCKILDFGIAKAVSGPEDGASLTRTGFVVGTPEFMSPEQLLGDPIDARSDVYSLALVAYNCLTAELPFDLKSPDRGMTARLFADPRPLRDAFPGGTFSESLQSVFDEALGRMADQRPASAGAFARRLADVIRPAGAPPLPTPISAQAVPPSPPPSVSVTAPDGTAASLAPPSRATPAVTTASTGGGRSRLPMVAVAVVLIGAVGGWLALRDRGSPSDPALMASASTAEGGGSVATAEGPAPAGSVSAPSVGDREAASRPSGTEASGSGTGPAASGNARGVPAPNAPSPATATGPGAASGRPASERDATPSSGMSATARAARATLDSVTRLIDPESPNPGVAREALGVLRAVLPRLGTSTDSTWAWIRMAEAHLILEQEAPACAALQSARRAATSPDQGRAITNYVGLLGCSP